jgi:hypothetical protein
MRIKKHVYSLMYLKYTALLFLIALVLTNPVRAASITFDDIPYIPVDPDWPQFDDVYVTDQYLSEGLLIEGGFLGRRYPLEENLANPQFLFGSNFMRMTFVGDRLPNYVTMTVSSVFESYANVINFYGPNGHLYEMITSGFDGWEPYKPYRPDQPISFTSLTGISEITFEGALNMRWGTLVDNLKFKSSPRTAVPEPGLLLLFCLGGGVLVLSRCRRSV